MRQPFNSKSEDLNYDTDHGRLSVTIIGFSVIH